MATSVSNRKTRRKINHQHRTELFSTGDVPKSLPSRLLPQWQLAAAGLLASFVIGWILYGPALDGQFVFDDLVLPFHSDLKNAPLTMWMSGVRPVLMLSYWLNHEFWGDGPFGYHFVNLIIHVANSGLVFLVISHLLDAAGWMKPRSVLYAAAGAVIFLFHPLQTESVSYVAGRSESLASLFMLLAYVCFLYKRRQPISWLAAGAVLAFFALSVGSKENAVSLAGILILTDLFWPEPFSTRGVRNNWRLYALMAPAAVVGAVAVFHLLATTPTAGFSVTTSRWYQYAFTEFRAIPAYIRLAVLPFGLSLDHDFPVSHTLTEHGAIFYALFLFAGVAALIRWRRRFPVSCFGILLFLVCLAPTSSVVPIDDALVERRMYLPLLGLILAASELVSRLKLSRSAACCILGGLVLFFGCLCYARNQLWGQPDKLLALAAMESSTNPRPMLNVTEILIRHNRCDLAVPYLQKAERILGINYFVEVGWGRILSCLNQDEEALRRFTLAATLEPTSSVFEWMGLLYGKMGRSEEAGNALKKAVALDPDSESAHGSLALWYASTRDLPGAEREYRAAISLDRSDLSARNGLMAVKQLEASGR